MSLLKWCCVQVSLRCELTLLWWPCLFYFYRPTLFLLFVTCFFSLFVLFWFFGNVFSLTNRYLTGFGPTFSIHGPYSLHIFCWDQCSDVTCGAPGLWKQFERDVLQDLKEGKSPNLIKTLWELSPSLWSCCSSFFCILFLQKGICGPLVNGKQTSSEVTSASESDDYWNLGRYAEKGGLNTCLVLVHFM